MRKPIVIGVIAVIGIGVLAVWVSEPKNGSVEYHRREYLEAIAPAGKWAGFLPVVTQERYGQWRAERAVSHLKALYEAGYLTRQSFAVSNRPVLEVASAAWGAADDSFRVFGGINTDNNLVVVSGPVDSMRKWADLIRAADVPESEK
jgi:hypothetical protein